MDDACDCRYKRPDTNSTDNDSYRCSYTQLSDGCLDRLSLFPRVFVQYFGSAQICLKRGGPTAINRAKFDEDTSSCPSGHRICGYAAGSGTIDNRICWPTSIADCPITDIGFSTLGMPSFAIAPNIGDDAMLIC